MSETRRPLSKPMTLLLALGVLGLVIMTLMGWRLLSAWNAFKLARPIVKEMNTGSVTRYLKLPMEKRYGERLDELPWKGYPWEKEDQSCLEALEKNEDDLLALSHRMGSERLAADWSEGVEGLDLPQPRWMDFSKLGHVVNYRRSRELGRRINTLGAYLRWKGRHQEALAVHLASLAAARQLVSISKSGAGLALIDAMITLAMIAETQRCLLDLGQATSWRRELFTPAFRKRQEDLDGRFSLVAESLELERTIVASFFRQMNEKASEKAGHGVVLHDAEAVLKRTARFFPSSERLEEPYEAIREDLAQITRQVIEASHLGVGSYVKGFFFPMDLVEKVMTTLSIPNVRKALEREYEYRALLRGCTLAHAIAAHRSREGSHPASLEALGSEVPAGMRLDPFTGRPFRYVVEGDGFRLWSTGKSCKDGEASPPQDAVIIVPWKRKR